MQFSKLFNDDRAVSPVIGVILMVAITVILAAVIGTFVLGLSDQVQDTSPRADFGFDYSPDATADTLEITHETGDEITATQLNVVISGASAGGADGSYAWNPDLSSDTKVSAGTSVTLDETNVGDGTNLDVSTATVRVTWASETGESTATLEKWSGPDA